MTTAKSPRVPRHSRAASRLRAAPLPRSALPLLAVMCLGSAAASGPPGTASVEEYVRAFNVRYELPAAEHDSLALADAALRRAERWWWPRISLREDLRAGAGGPALDLSLSSRTVLYDSGSAPSTEVALADLALRTALADQAMTLATAAFLQDVVAYAVLAPASELARSAEAATSDHRGSLDPLTLTPSQRSRYENALSERDGASWLDGAVRDVQERLAHTLAVPVEALAPPALEDAAKFVGKAVARALGLRYTGMDGPSGRHYATAPPAGTDALVFRCLEEAPALRVARARRDLTLSDEHAAAAPDLVLELVATADHSVAFTSNVASSPLTATIGLEARFGLPGSWPLAGSVSASADLSGASQLTELSWPPTARPDLHQPDAERVLRDETAQATWDARALWRAYEQAAAERARRGRALAWAVLDTYPELSRMEVKSLSAAPLSAAWQTTAAGADTSLIRPRVEVALAQLGELAAAVDLAAFCGALPSAPAN